MTAWDENGQALKNWLVKKTGDSDQAEDLLQDIFIKALQNKTRFCTLTHAKSWLFTIARNTLIDSYRQAKLEIYADSDSGFDSAAQQETAPIVNLQQCLSRVLGELDEQDKEVIELCDIQGLSQNDYAKRKGLTLSACKSRVQRARKKLREQMILSCRVEFDPQGVCCFTPRK